MGHKWTQMVRGTHIHTLRWVSRWQQRPDDAECSTATADSSSHPRSSCRSYSLTSVNTALVPSLVTKTSETEVGKVIGVQNPISKTLITFLQNEAASANPFAFFQLKFLAQLVAVMATACFFCCSSGKICWLHQSKAEHAGADAAPLHLDRSLLGNCIEVICSILRGAWLKAQIQRDFPFLP